MLHRLELNNFMSYESLDLNLKGSDTVSIVGEVGSGKSAILESIYYVLYGELRVDTVNEVIMIGKDSMFVKLYLSLQKDVYIITRGRKSTSGYVTIHKNNKLVCKGKESISYISKLFGMSSDLFTLTSFFGVGDDDTLMETLPSKRLETLQKISKVDKYKKYYDEVSRRLVRKQEEYNLLRQSLDYNYIDFEVRAGSLTQKDELYRTNLDNVVREMELKIKRKDSIMLEMKAYRVLLSESSSLSTDLENKKTHIKKLNSKKDDLLFSKNDSASILKSLNVQRLKLDGSQKKFNCDILQKNKEAIQTIISEKKVTLDLLDLGLSNADNIVNCVCPLCKKSNVTKDTVEMWSKDRLNLRTDIVRCNQELSVVVKQLNDFNKIKSSISDIDIQVSKLLEKIKGYEKDILEIEKQIDVYQTHISKAEIRLQKVKKSLNDYKDIDSELNTLQSELQDLQKNSGSLQEQLRTNEKEIKNLKNEKLNYEKTKRQCLSLKREMKALNLLKSAYSRYGIPLDLTKNLELAIQKEATKLYNYFSDGSILVRETEDRGLPGVEFILSDLMGERRYKQLSKGQRALMSLTIRVAVSLIIRRELDIKIDFLFLDEIAGHLDPKRRDSLMKMVCVLLRNYYSQIFVVSHIPLKDIFSKLLEVSIQDGKSLLKVD